MVGYVVCLALAQSNFSVSREKDENDKQIAVSKKIRPVVYDFGSSLS